MTMYKIILFFVLIKAAKLFELNSAPSPGVLFEQQKDIKIIEEKWQLIIAIDFAPTKLNISQVITQFDELQISCILPIKNCTHFRDKYNDLKLHLERIENNWNTLRECALMLENVMQEKVLNLLSKQVKILKNENKEIILNKHSKTILVESNLTQITSSMIRKNKNLLKELETARNISMGRSQYDPKIFIQSYNNAYSLMKEKIKKYTRITRTIEECLKILPFGKLSADLLSTDAINTILGDLNKLTEPLQVPFTKNTTLMKNLQDISEISFGTIDEYAFVVIDISFMKAEPTITYKIHTFSVPQQLKYSNNTSLRIRIDGKYLILQDNYHVILNEKEFNSPSNCKSTTKYFLCEKSWLTFTNETSCEYEIFRRPQKMSLKLCPIQYRNTFEPNFVKLRSISGWYYITNRPIFLQKTCEDKLTSIVRLEEAGIMKFTPDCTVQYLNSKLTLTPIQDYLPQNIIFPNLNLQLQNISTLFKTRETRALFQKNTDEDLIYNLWTVEQQCIDEIRTTRENEEVKYTLKISLIVGSCILALLVLIASFVTALCYVVKETPSVQEITFNREPRIDDVRVTYKNTTMI